MKRTLCLIAAAALAGGFALAQKPKPTDGALTPAPGKSKPAEKKPAAPAKTDPAAPAPAGTPAAPPATASGAAPAPGTPAAPTDLGPFKTPAERRSYAMGVRLANQLRANMDDGSRKINYADIEAGIKAAYTGDKSLDYAQGMGIGAGIKQDDAKIDLDTMLTALRETAAGVKVKLDDVAIQTELTALQQEMKSNRQLKLQAEAARNLKVAEEFLAKNKAEKDVQTTASGLQYKVLKPGTNDRKPGPTDMVSVKYVASLVDGREFDRTKDDAPRTVPLTLGKGWGEGLQLMTIGAKHRLWIPPGLAWGEMQRGTVRPNSVLIYDVELIDAIPAPQPPTQPGVVATPPVAIPRAGTNPADPNRKPITAVTPPVSVEIPPNGGKPIITPGDNPNKLPIPPRARQNTNPTAPGQATAKPEPSAINPPPPPAAPPASPPAPATPPAENK